MSSTTPSPSAAASTVRPPGPATVACAHADPLAVGVHDQIDRLSRVVDEMWRSEPDVAPGRRSRLLERLARLEHDVVRLSLQHQADDPVDADLLVACHTEADDLRSWWPPTGSGGGRRAA